MIHQIMIIANSGISVFNHEFSVLKIDPILFGGFTTALNSFSQEMIEKEQNIESIKMSRLKLIISAFKIYNLVLVVNKYDELSIFRSLIVELQNIFLEMFGHFDESELNCISNFDSFRPIAISICRSHIDIAIISAQSQMKMEFWKFMESISSKVVHQTKSNQNWNTLQIKLESTENCDVSIWNVDLEQNFEYMKKIIENKPIVFLLIEPTLKGFFDFIPLIQELRQTMGYREIYCISVKNYGHILRYNCEVILKVPVFELDLNSESEKQILFNKINHIVQGSF